MDRKLVSPKVNFKCSRPSAATARWTALGLTLSAAALLSGCSGLNGSHAVSEGRGVLAYRVPTAGQVQVTDISIGLPLYEGRLMAHDLIEMDPFRQEIRVNQETVANPRTSSADEYRISFKPAPTAEPDAAGVDWTSGPQTQPATAPTSESTSELSSEPTSEPATGPSGESATPATAPAPDAAAPAR